MKNLQIIFGRRDTAKLTVFKQCLQNLYECNDYNTSSNNYSLPDKPCAQCVYIYSTLDRSQIKKNMLEGFPFTFTRSKSFVIEKLFIQLPIFTPLFRIRTREIGFVSYSSKE